MGYTTDFEGKFEFDRPLDDKTYSLLLGLSTTRRMKRNVDSKYGIEGEFYIKGGGYAGQDEENNIVDYNVPPRTQPSLWCKWTPTEDRNFLVWDGGEKFYAYTEWLTYLIETIIAPNGYKLTGAVTYQGEDSDDYGTICCYENQVYLMSEKISAKEFEDKKMKLLGV